jgi:chromate transporter
MAGIAVLSFVAIYFLGMPFPAIIISAGAVGLAGSYLKPSWFDLVTGHDTGDAESGYVRICDDDDACHIHPSARRNLRLLAVFALLWLVPVLALARFGTHHVYFTEALFFTKAAFLTFGGAYAVLAYIAQAGVAQYAWLSGSQMIDGLGLAETTPGPLIMVVQFVGFMAGWNQAGSLNPLWGGLIGSLVATYFTFLPCFMFIFLGGPYIEKFRRHVRLSAALSSITAAVVGVVLNLAVWFGLQVLLPADGGFDIFATLVGLSAFAAIQWFKVGMLPVIVASGFMGLLWHHVIL